MSPEFRAIEPLFIAVSILLILGTIVYVAGFIWLARR